MKGYQLELVSPPLQREPSPPPPPTPIFSQAEHNVINSEIEELLLKRAVHLIPNIYLPQGFVSNLFVEPKRGGGGGGIPSCYKSKAPQSVLGVSTLQDGRHSHAMGSFKKKATTW